MNKETAEFLVNVTEQCGNQKASLREDYSGRCMYNQTTYAVVVDNFGQLLADVLNYVRDNIGEYVHDNESAQDHKTWDGADLTEEVDQFSVDSMGRGVVIY